MELSEQEQKAVAFFTEYFNNRKEPAKPVTSTKLITMAWWCKGIQIAEPQFRNVIHHIRVNHLVINLLANGNGYYVASEGKLIKEYIRTLESRAKEIQEVANSFKL